MNNNAPNGNDVTPEQAVSAIVVILCLVGGMWLLLFKAAAAMLGALGL